MQKSSSQSQSKLQEMLLKTLIVLIICNLSWATRSPFPKVIGGSQGHTKVYAMDYNDASSALVAAGDTFDPGIRGNYGTTTEGTAVMIAYRGTCMSMIWAKAVKSPLMYFLQVQFNPDATSIISFALTQTASANDNQIMIFHAFTGERTLAFSYPNSGQGEQFARLMLLNSGQYPEYGYITINQGTDITVPSVAYLTFKFAAQASTFSTAPKWAYVLSNIVGVKALGYLFGESESIVYRFIYNGAYCMVMRQNAVTGNLIRNHLYYQCPITNHDFTTTTFSSSSMQMTVVIAGDTDRKIWVIKENISSSVSVISSLVYTEVSSTEDPLNYLKSRSILITSETTINVLLSGKMGYLNAVTVAQIDLTSTIVTYQVVLPPLMVDAANAPYYTTMGRLFSGGRFYIATLGLYMSTDSSSTMLTFVGPSNSIIQSIIYTSSVQQSGGYSMAPTSFVGTLILETAIVPTNSIPSLTSTTITLSAITLSTNDLADLSSFTNIDSSCPADPSYVETSQYALYYLNPEKSFIFYPGVGTLTLAQTWFGVKMLCGGVAPSAFTYSIKLSDGVTSCPSWVTIDAITGTLTIDSSSVPGTLNILVKGSLSTGESINQAVQLLGSTAYIPVLGTAIKEAKVVNGQSSSLKLYRTIKQPNVIVSLSLIEIGTGTLPSFIKVNLANLMIYLSPFSSTETRTYSMQLKMITTYYTVTSNFDVTVLALESAPPNLGPPMFDEPIPDITVLAGSTTTYTLPSMSDVDDDAFSGTLYFGEAVMFTSFKDMKFTFLPLASQVRATPYVMKIKLVDKNLIPKSSTTIINVFVVASEPPASPPSTQNTTQQANSTAASSNSSDSTSEEEDANLAPARAISEATASGAQVKYAKGQIRIMKANQFGELKVQVKGDFLIGEMVQIVKETDFKAILLTQNKQIVPIRIKKKDRNAGTFVIELLFPNSENISINNEIDTIELKTTRELVATSGSRRRVLIGRQDVLKVLTIPSGQVQRKDLPVQLSASNAAFAQALQQGADYGSYVFLSGSLIVNIFMSMFMNFIWDLLNDLSFMMILSFISISVPGLVQMIQTIFLSFIYMDLLQTDKWLPQLFFTQDEVADDEALNMFFDINGFGSTKLINNLGSTFVFLVIFLALHTFLFIFSCFFEGCTKCGDSIIKALSAKLYWGGSVRFILQQFTPLALSSAVNLYNVRYDTTGDIISISLSICILGITPLFILILSAKLFCARRSQQLSQDAFGKNYGCLVQDLNTKSFIGTFWNILILLRWMCTVAIIVVLRESNYLQIMALLLLSITYLVLLIHGRPFPSRGEITLAAFNELMVSCYLYLIICLTDYNEAHSFKEELGLGLLGCIFLTVLVNVMSTLCRLLGVCCRRLMLKCCREKTKKRALARVTAVNQQRSSHLNREAQPVEHLSEGLNDFGQTAQSTLQHLRKFNSTISSLESVTRPAYFVSPALRRENFHRPADLEILKRIEVRTLMNINQRLINQLQPLEVRRIAPQLEDIYIDESFSEEESVIEIEQYKRAQTGKREIVEKHSIWSEPKIVRGRTQRPHHEIDIWKS